MIIGRHKKGIIGKRCFHDPEYDGAKVAIYGAPMVGSNGHCAIVQTEDSKLHVWNLDCLEFGKFGELHA